jgi:hypothetical protein
MSNRSPGSRPGPSGGWATAGLNDQGKLAGFLTTANRHTVGLLAS